MPRKQWICPICGGAGDSTHCPCHGEGIITREEAVDWTRHGTVVVRLPDPPADMPSMCHDCAFRKDSPERESFGAWPAIESAVREGTPFICHQGMHETDDGRYIPFERDAKGIPVWHPVCAGWAAARAKVAP
jgi:hypothetical protein